MLTRLEFQSAANGRYYCIVRLSSDRYAISISDANRFLLGNMFKTSPNETIDFLVETGKFPSQEVDIVHKIDISKVS